MKTFNRPNFALYFQGEDQILSELSRQDVLLIKSSMNETELKAVWIYHPSQRDWIPIEQHQEIFEAPFEFQRNVKSPQPRLPEASSNSRPPPQHSPSAHATVGRQAPQSTHPAPPKSAQTLSPPEARQTQRPQVSAKPSGPPVMPTTPPPRPAVSPKPTAPPTMTQKSQDTIPSAPSPSRAQPQASIPGSSTPASNSKSPLQSVPAKESAASSASFQGTDVQKYGIIAKAIKFSGFQAQVVRLDSKHLQTNQPWPFDKDQSGVLKLSYLNQDYTLEGSVEKHSGGNILILKENLDYLYFKDFLHFLGVS